ncbi:MAG: hypothetical protein GWN93_06170 [Deltaproteobacteria bacterium]|nr:hypothetical protein [Deltaproteobacteria bacterium]
MSEERPMYNRANGIAGYDPATGRWRDGDGRFRTEHEIMNQPRTAVMAGHVVEDFDYAQASRLSERLEHIIGGVDPRTLSREWETGTEPMPASILAMMRLSDYYSRVEGDVFQAIEAPLDIAMKPLEFRSPDQGYRDDLEELYREANIDMFQTLYYIWMCSGIFGQAFPLEVVADTKDTLDESRVLLIPPKNVDVGRSFSLGGGMSIRPPGFDRAGRAVQWTRDLFEAAFPPMSYTRRAIDFNEQIAEGAGVIINPGHCVPVREKSLPFQRYAIPPMMRASRAISTRRVFEEMRRATVEGYKNQLWLFLLGDEENMPLPDEISHLGDAVAGLYGERTGALVWTGNLRVELVVPEAPDSMMANETYVGLTMEIFRRLGISLKIISGERGPLGGAARAGDLELDISVLLDRLTFKINQMYRWERQFRAKLARKMGDAAVKADKKTAVTFGGINMQVERDVRERLLPTYQAGVLSIRTFLEEGGWEWMVELQNKKEEERLRDLFSPPPSFAQTTVKPETPEKDSEQTPSPGRPRDDNDDLPEKVADEVKAGVYFEAAADFAAYVSDVYGEFDKMLDEGASVSTFITSLKQTNREWMYQFALDGYNAGGGILAEPPGLRTWTNKAVGFVNSYANDFGDRLREVYDDPERLEGKRWNAYLYPQEGRHLAYMYGLQWAMKERGARGWQRILHPEQSSTGPCVDCVADSVNVHPIDEPFFEFHPYGVCSAQGVAFYTDATGQPMLQVPVPRKVFDVESIMDVLKRLGEKVQRIVRRVRGE